MAREEHTADIEVKAEQVILEKSTHITGEVEIKGNVLVKGELIVNGPLVISGAITAAPGSVIHIEGTVVHNGEIEK